MPNWAKYCIAAAFIVGLGFCLYFISAGNLGGREAGLLSFVLFILSVLATWILTHLYSQSQHKKAIEEVQEAHRTNLRTYALKAAEKVNNLSTQLSQLAVYLEESLEESDDERLREDLLSKQERIEGAIRMINMLKSINDTALSDWEGVIGDELNQQREMQAEKEEEFGRLVERLEAISASQIDTQRYAQDSSEALAREMASIRKDMRSMASGLGLPSFILGKPYQRKITRAQVERHCPQCGEVMVYQQKKNPKSVKLVRCRSCNEDFISRYDTEREFILEKRQTVKEQIACPTCHVSFEVQLDTFPSSSLGIECNNCHSLLTVTRTRDGIAIRTKETHAEAKMLTDDIVELVKNNLPPQPWPAGTNKAVAEKLGLPRKLVSDAIAKLVRMGVYKLQFDGKVYVPEPSIKKKRSKEIDSGEG